MAAKTDWMKTFVGLSVIAIFGTQALYMLKYEIPEANKEIVHFMLGTMDGSLLTIIAYYFGSSKGSQEKQRTLDKITDEKTTS